VAAFVVARPSTSNTPLYTVRMEQVSSKMNFLPTEMNSFTYTAENGYKLNLEVGGYWIADQINLDTTPQNTCRITCVPICPPDTLGGHTCEDTSCQPTCLTQDPTCPYTCITCNPTCDDPWTCPDTCPFTCNPTCNDLWTCYLSTCEFTCEFTCEYTCFTCNPTCNDPWTCGLSTCKETCPDTCWETCTGPECR
jgi:hypothetical protein